MITYRTERPADFEAIGELHYRAFTGHPQHAPGAEPTEHRIVDGLRRAGALRLSLLALDQGRIVGHAALSPLTVGGEDTDWLGLGPIAVVPERQGAGIGTGLMRETIARARAMGGRGIALVGDPGFYSRFGFRSHPGLTLPGVPQANVLGLALDGPVPTGGLGFHPAFFEA